MPWSKAADVLLLLYCIEIGILLVVAPWSPWWDRVVMHIPILFLRDLYLQPMVRGGFTGIGLAHLVLAAHDLDQLLGGRSRHGQSLS